MVSVSEVSGDWEDAFKITSESDSESGSWGIVRFSALEKSGGSGLLASFHGWVCCGGIFMRCLLVWPLCRSHVRDSGGFEFVQ